MKITKKQFKLLGFDRSPPCDQIWEILFFLEHRNYVKYGEFGNIGNIENTGNIGHIGNMEHITRDCLICGIKPWAGN